MLFQLQRYSLAAEAYSQCLKVDDRTARVSYKLALVHYTAGNLDAAISTLDQTLRLDDRMANAHYLLGMSLRDKHRNADAVSAFEKAVALAPGLIAAREELADLYRAGDRHADELEQLQVLAGLDRGHVDRQVAVGLAQARAGHRDLAVTTLGNALERRPEADQPLIYGALGQVWLDLAQARNDSVDAEQGARSARAGRVGSRRHERSAHALGRALLRDGQIELAEQTLAAATTRYPLEPTALRWYATAAERQNHLDIARRALIDYNGLVDDDGEMVARATRIATLSLRLNEPGPRSPGSDAPRRASPPTCACWRRWPTPSSEPATARLPSDGRRAPSRRTRTTPRCSPSPDAFLNWFQVRCTCACPSTT